jgi:hypothetical protein
MGSQSVHLDAIILQLIAIGRPSRSRRAKDVVWSAWEADRAWRVPAIASRRFNDASRFPSAPEAISSVPELRPHCAYVGRSRPLRRRSNADIRPGEAIGAQISAAGGQRPFPIAR